MKLFFLCLAVVLFLGTISGCARPSDTGPYARINPVPADGTVNASPPAEEAAADALRKEGAKLTRDNTRPGRPVVAVRLRVGTATPDLLGHLAELRHVEELTLGVVAVERGDYESIQKCLAALPTLRRLDLRDPAHHEGFVWIPHYRDVVRLKQLTCLRLPGCSLDMLRELATLPDLEELDIDVMGKPEQGFGPMAGICKRFPRLKHLGLRIRADVTDLDLHHIGEIPHLRRLAFVPVTKLIHKEPNKQYYGGSPVTDTGLLGLVGLGDLESLDIDVGYGGSGPLAWTPYGLTSLRSLPRLKRLRLAGFMKPAPGTVEGPNGKPGRPPVDPERDELCRAFRGMANLEEFDIKDLRIWGGFDYAWVRALPHLKILRLDGTHLRDNHLKGLKGLNELRVLDLRQRGPIQPPSNDVISWNRDKLPPPEEREMSLGDAGVQELAVLGSLEELYLAGHKERLTGTGLGRF